MFKMRAKMISVGLLGTAALVPVDFAMADQLGRASWYSLPKNITANGERMNPNALTAAHRSLPFGTRVLVENLANGRSVVVRINDRGPFTGGRIIDLSKAAAANIGMIAAGTAKVRVTTAGGGMLAALDKSKAEKKSARPLSVAARAAPAKPTVELAASVSAKMTQPAPKLAKAARQMAKASPKSSKAKSVAVASASKKRHAASIKLAAFAKRSTARGRAKAGAKILAEHGIRAAAQRASSPGMRIADASSWKKQRTARMAVKVAAVKGTKANARARARANVLAAAEGIRAAGQQASGFSSRRTDVASNTLHPYAVLGTRPGFMEPARTRPRRAAG